MGFVPLELMPVKLAMVFSWDALQVLSQDRVGAI